MGAGRNLHPKRLGHSYAFPRLGGEEPKVYPEVPPRVEYALTDRGRSFMPVMQQLMDWAYDNLYDIVTDRERYYGQD